MTDSSCLRDRQFAANTAALAYLDSVAILLTSGHIEAARELVVAAANALREADAEWDQR